MDSNAMSMKVIEFGIPKVIVVILVLVAANILWSYFKRVKRRAEANTQAQEPKRDSTGKRKPSDSHLGEYVDYEELKED